MTVKAVLIILFIGVTSGIGFKLGCEVTKVILDNFRKPVTVKIKHSDGSTSTMKLTHEEANGYKKITDVISKEE